MLNEIVVPYRHLQSYLMMVRIPNPHWIGTTVQQWKVCTLDNDDHLILWYNWIVGSDRSITTLDLKLSYATSSSQKFYLPGGILVQWSPFSDNRIQLPHHHGAAYTPFSSLPPSAPSELPEHSSCSVKEILFTTTALNMALISNYKL